MQPEDEYHCLDPISASQSSRDILLSLSSACISMALAMFARFTADCLIIYNHEEANIKNEIISRSRCRPPCPRPLHATTQHIVYSQIMDFISAILALL
nr:hypothetical protein CFP56_64892 [Quercus suber]